MLRIYDWTTLRSAICRRAHFRPLAVTLVGAALVISPAAEAATIDFNAVSGNYDSTLDPGPPHSNWITTLDGSGTPVSVPATTDDAYVRNNGTVTVTANVQNNTFRIGASNVITLPDTTTQQIGQPGTLNWTGGVITGGANGPALYVGERDDATNTNFTGTVNQNGATTKISLPSTSSVLTIGRNGSTPTPTSVYNLINGTIGLVIQSTGGPTTGSNGNNGINVRNGTFNMTGGAIIDETPAGTLTEQRFITISSASGADAANSNVATANFSGGTVDVLGGIRVAPSANAKGYLNISGNVVMNVGGEVGIGYNAGSSTQGPGIGEMTMTGGQLNVGTAASTKRFQVGLRGPGSLAMSGGSINVTNEIRVGAEAGSGGSSITMTGGTITTNGLNIRNAIGLTDPGASIILDGPNAVFTQNGTGGSTIGAAGIGLFEVRQGTASLALQGLVQLGSTAASKATLNVKGGKLTIGGAVNKTTAAAADPVIGLTGGILDISPPVASTSVTWQTHFKNQGTEVNLRTGSTLLVNLGTAGTHVGNFEMTSGSLNIDIASNTLAGADRFAAQFATATGSLTGGTLNLNYLSGYTPTPGIELFIVRTPLTGSVTLNAPAVTINAPGGDTNWYLKTVTTATNNEIRLAYVPEPTACVLAIMGLMAGMVASRRRS